MTYRIEYVVVEQPCVRFGAAKHRRGTFVLDAADAAGAHAGGERVLRDACDFAARSGQRPHARITSVLPCEPPAPTFDDALAASARKRGA